VNVWHPRAARRPGDLSPEAVRLAQEIGYPVVLKIVLTDILHKTDAGGVLTGLASPAAVAQGYNTILANAGAYKARRTSWRASGSRCYRPLKRSLLAPH